MITHVVFCDSSSLTCEKYLFGTFKPITEISPIKTEKTLIKSEFFCGYIFFVALWWSRWQDLNLRPLRPERSALPNWATPRYLILYANLLLCAFLHSTRALRLLLRCPKKLRYFVLPCFFDRGAFSLSLHLHLAAVKLKATKLSHASLFNYALKSTNISDLLII